MKHKIYITIGRWGSSDTTIENLDNASILKAIAEHLVQITAAGNDYRNMATQVLVWCDTNGVHNLIAVYDIQSRDLTEF